LADKGGVQYTGHNRSPRVLDYLLRAARVEDLMPPKGDRPRFPAARIKKMMQADEDVGRIAAGVPPLVCELPPFPASPATPTLQAEAGLPVACTAKCLELFGAALLEKATAAASRQETSILQVSHMCASSQRPSTERERVL
jgi:hypothetical protein